MGLSIAPLPISARCSPLQAGLRERRAKSTLPLEPEAAGRIRIIGDGAAKPAIQGSGSATTNPFRVDIPLDEIRTLAGRQTTVSFLPFGTGGGLDPQPQIVGAVEAAGDAYTIIVFANHRSGKEGEGSDRSDLCLALGQAALIDAVSRLGRRIIVILTIQDAVVMPWIDKVDAVLACFYPGQ